MLFEVQGLVSVAYVHWLTTGSGEALRTDTEPGSDKLKYTVSSRFATSFASKGFSKPCDLRGMLNSGTACMVLPDVGAAMRNYRTERESVSPDAAALRRMWTCAHMSLGYCRIHKLCICV